MKKKKIVIFILIFLIMILSVCSLSIKLVDGKKQVLIGISDYKIFNNKEISLVVDDLYLIKNSKGKIEVTDKTSEIFAELGENVSSGKRVTSGYLIYDSNGTYLLSSEKNVKHHFNKTTYEMIDYRNKNIYYYELDDNRCILYDSNFNVVMELNNDASIKIDGIFDDLVYGSNKKIYSIKTHEEVGSYEAIVALGEDYYLIDGDVKRLVDVQKRIIYDVQSFYKKNNRYVISVNGENYIIDEKGERYTNVNKDNLTDEYYMDANACDKGWKLKKNDGTVVYSDCADSYNISRLDDGVLIINNVNDNYVYKINNTTSREYAVILYEGDYIYAVDENGGYLFDMKGFKVYDGEIESFKYIDNGQYVLKNNNGALLLDENLNELASYDDMICKDSLCITMKNNKYGLFYNGKEQTNNIFLEAMVGNDYCVIKDIAFDAIIYFEKTDSNKDIKEIISLQENYYDEINTNDILEKYHLESKRNMVLSDEKLFKKYAYVIEHNEKVNGYKDILFKFYEAIVNEKEYVNENKLLSSLKQLKISEKDSVVVNGAAGVYNDSKKEIEFLKGNFIPSVYYHELYHFLDYNIDYSKDSHDYMCNGKIYSVNEYNGYSDKQKCHVMTLPFAQFVTEAGAEIYSVSYFIDNEVIRAYQWGTYIYEMLNYLLGNKVMKDIYYSPDTTYDFYKLMVKGYKMPYEDYNELLTIFNKLTKIETMYDEEAMDQAKSWLIYLYNIKNPNKNWEDDLEFSYYIKYGQGIDKYNSNRDLHNINANIMLEIYGIRKGYNIKDIHVRDNGTYIYFEILDYNYSIIDNIRVLYDFKNMKMIEYKRIEGA